MRIVHEEKMKEYDNVSQQLEAALIGAYDKIQGIQATSKILSNVLLNAESQDRKAISTYELSAIIKMLEYMSEKAYTNIANIQEVLGLKEIKKALENFEENDIIEEYTRRDLTTQECNEDNREFFDSYFSRGTNNAR